MKRTLPVNVSDLLAILFCLALIASASMQAAAQSQTGDTGTLERVAFDSSTLGGEISYLVYLPAGYESSIAQYPVLYMLHGRGDNLTAWSRVVDLMDAMIASGEMPAVIAIMPNAPWSDRASYYVDSAYTGQPYPGQPVESAFINDLIPHVDAAYRTIKDRAGRVVLGYSMGGYGAIRYSLAHADVFSAAIVLSPAVYTPLPPQGSSTREFGAFGKGDQLFDDLIYQTLNYPALLDTFAAARLQITMFIAVGDDEVKNPLPEEQYNDIDMEAHLLYNRVSRVRGIMAELRVYDGGHDWKVWRQGFSEGMRMIGPRLT